MAFDLSRLRALLRSQRLLVVTTAALLVVIIIAAIIPAKLLPRFPMTACLVLLAVLGFAGAIANARSRPEAETHWLREPGTWVLVALLALYIGLFLAQTRRLTGDGAAYYVYLRSLAVDHDLEFGNDLRLLGQPPSPITPTGRTASWHPIGPSLLWAPLYPIASLLARLFGQPLDGLSRFHLNAVSLAGLLWGWIGLVLFNRTFAPRLGRGTTLVATLGLGLGTFLPWYISYEPTMAHGLAVTMTALFLNLWLRDERLGWKRGVKLGLALGLVALVRPVDGLVGLILLYDAVLAFRTRQWRGLVQQAAAIAGTFIVVFSPQFWVWRLFYGSFVAVPQGTAYIAGKPAYDGALFGPDHGLFSWSPLLYLGVLGLVLLLRSDTLRAVPVFLFLFGLTRLNAGIIDFGGSEFGARRFDAALPFLAWGLAVFVRAAGEWTRRHAWAPAAALVAAFVLANLLVMRTYESGVWGYARPVAFEQMGHAVVSEIDTLIGPLFSLPGALYQWALTGRTPAEYERPYVRDAFTRVHVLAGRDDRFTFWQGWSPPTIIEGESCRQVRGTHGVLILGLNGKIDYVLGCRLLSPAGPEEQAHVSVVVNGRRVGRWLVGRTWSDQTILMPASAMRRWRNELHLVPGRSSLAVAGLWAEPASVAAAAGALPAPTDTSVDTEDTENEKSTAD